MRRPVATSSRMAPTANRSAAQLSSVLAANPVNASAWVAGGVPDPALTVTGGFAVVVVVLPALATRGATVVVVAPATRGSVVVVVVVTIGSVVVVVVVTTGHAAPPS